MSDMSNPAGSARSCAISAGYEAVDCCSRCAGRCLFRRVVAGAACCPDTDCRAGAGRYALLRTSDTLCGSGADAGGERASAALRSVRHGGAAGGCGRQRADDGHGADAGVHRDSTYYARVVGPVVGPLEPRLDFIETYNRTVERVQLVREPYAWEFGPAAGAWMTRDGGGVWAGAYARRTFGRFSVSASAGYDARNKSAFGQVQAGMALWRR